jgi:hypothetical protein
MKNTRDPLSIETSPNTIIIEQNNNIDIKDNYSPHRNNGSHTSKYSENNNYKYHDTLEENQYKAKSIPNLLGSFEDNPRRSNQKHDDEQDIVTSKPWLHLNLYYLYMKL